MKIPIYLLIGSISILFSSVFTATAQEEREKNIAVFYYAGFAADKLGKVYFAVTYDENRGDDITSIHMKENKPWVEKISKKVNKDTKLDFLELADVTGEAYVRYCYAYNYLLEYDFSQPEIRTDGRVLRIELPHEIFSYHNVMKLYRYVMDHIDMSEKEPYRFTMEEEEILKVLQ